MGKSLIVVQDPTKPRRAKRKNETIEQRLWHYYNDTKRSTPLSKKQEHIRQMVEDAWLFYGSEYQRAEAIRKVAAKYEIGPTRAKQIMNLAEKIIGNPKAQVKAAKRHLHVERLERLMKKLEDKGEWELLHKYATRYEKIMGMENPEEANMEDLAKMFKGHQIVFKTDPETLKAQAEQLVRDIVDTDYEEVEDAGTEG